MGFLFFALIFVPKTRKGDARVALDALVQLHRDDSEGLLRACHVSLSVGPRSRAMVDAKPKIVQGQHCPAVAVTVAYDAPWEPSLKFRYQLMYARRHCALRNACKGLQASYPNAVCGVKTCSSASLCSQQLAISRLSDMLAKEGTIGEGRPVTIHLAPPSAKPLLEGDIFTLPVSWGHH